MSCCEREIRYLLRLYKISLNLKNAMIGLSVLFAIVYTPFEALSHVSANDGQYVSYSYIFISRALERVAIIASGFSLVYFGYKLFISGVSGEASLKAKRGDGGLELVNAAPGIFFALFGVLLISLIGFKDVELKLSKGGQAKTLFSDSGYQDHQISRPSPDRDNITDSELSYIKLAVDHWFDTQKDADEFQNKLRIFDAYRALYIYSGSESQELSFQTISINVNRGDTDE